MPIALLLFFGLVFPGAVSAQEPALRFSVQMRQAAIHVGEPVRVGITVKHPKEMQVTWPAIGSSWKDAAVDRFVSHPARAQQGWVAERRDYWLASFTPGAHALETGKFAYRGPDGKGGAIDGPQIKITVASRLPEKWHPLDIKPIKPAVFILRLWLIAVLAALAAAGAGFWLWRRRQQQASADARPALKPAHEIALEALEQLAQDNLPKQGQFGRYYVRLSGIVRAYVERRFQLHAPEMTTEEFLKTATQASALSSGHQSLLRDFLAQSDLVKFAQYQPSLQEAEAAFEAALRFVRETMPRSALTDAAAAAVS